MCENSQKSVGFSPRKKGFMTLGDIHLRSWDFLDLVEWAEFANVFKESSAREESERILEQKLLKLQAGGCLLSSGTMD